CLYTTLFRSHGSGCAAKAPLAATNARSPRLAAIFLFTLVISRSMRYPTGGTGGYAPKCLLSPGSTGNMVPFWRVQTTLCHQLQERRGFKCAAFCADNLIILSNSLNLGR